jgi:hypothetical protein
MKNIITIKLIILLLLAVSSHAQTVIWTGNGANNDFFDEANWKNSVTELAPENNTIDAGQAINFQLQINNVAATINANGEIALGSGSLTISLAKLIAISFSGGNVSVNEGAYIDLSSTTPLLNAVQVNFTSGIAWIKTLNTSARSISASNLAQLKVNGTNAFYKTNLRLDNYYQNGCVIRPNLPTTTTPLKIYGELNLQGTETGITINTIHSGAAIANAMNNKTQSFVLKKGFMVTFAVENDGTGKSKNYIASEEDLVINALPRAIRNSISFIRVMPWNWATKKGRTGTQTDLATSWRYQWNNTESSTLDWEYAPMAWGGSAANDSGDIATYVGKYNSTHVMAFNEADNCNDQSGQFGNPKLCVIDEAVRLYKNLMKTGMRLVSPSGTEGAATGWLKDFHAKATAQDIRIDVIGVHWYDWGGSPSSSPNADATQVFNRFKTYLTNVHNLYGLPIWITEFNANPYRSTAVQLAFMKLALPYLETLSYVERYNWFQPNPTPLIPDDNANQVGTGEFYTTRPAGSAPILTDVGIAYRDQVSTPSIPEATTDEKNNLSLAEYPNVALKKIATANSSFSVDYGATKAVDGDSTTSVSQWIVNFGTPADVNYVPLPAWLKVDLQGTFTIESFKITEFFRALKNFSFDVWDTSLNAGSGGWKSVVAETANPATPLTTVRTFTPVTTTKVRLNINEHNSSSSIRLFELEVFGYVSENLGLNQYKKQPFAIYPNPVSKGELTINGEQEVKSVAVYSILGTKMNVSFENGKVSVGKLASGIYFIKINNEHTIKFLIK